MPFAARDVPRPVSTDAQTCIHVPHTQGHKPGTKCGGRPVQGVWGTKSPEAEAILDFYMHNFGLILNYFCFARATSGWIMLRNGSYLSMK